MLSGIVISSWSISSCWNVKTWQQDCNLSKNFLYMTTIEKNMLCVANSNSSKDHKNCFHSIKTCNCLKQNQVNRTNSTLTIIYLQFENTFVRSWKMLLIINFNFFERQIFRQYTFLFYSANKLKWINTFPFIRLCYLVMLVLDKKRKHVTILGLLG